MLSAAFKVVAGIGLAATIGAVAEWKTDLKPVGESTVGGDATVRTAAPSMSDTTRPAMAQFTADVNVKGGKDGETLPWHVHSGTCGTQDAPIVGAATDYAPIKVEASGDGKATATVNGELAPNGQYLVNIHKSAEDLTVISCGELKASGMIPSPSR